MIGDAAFALAQPITVEQTVLRRVASYFDAMAKGDMNVVAKALADDYRVVGGDGKEETRNERLAWLTQNKSALTALTPRELRVRVYGSSAVVTGVVLIPADAKGPEVRERFTQVWVKRDTSWQMVSGQITIVKR
jgi:ketosteroid isomerase-like protein